MCLFYRARRKEIRSRESLSDEDFCKQVAVPAEDYPFAVDLRRAMALCCKVPPEKIKPDDIFDDYADMMDPTGWDKLALIFSLEKVTGRKHHYDRAIVKLPKPTRTIWDHPGISMKEWIRQALPELKKTYV